MRGRAFHSFRSLAMAGWLLGFQSSAQPLQLSDDLPLLLPAPGAYQLRVLAPKLLELTLITTKKPDPAQVEQWNFVDEKGEARLPNPRQFIVSVGNKTIEVKAVGFKRRVLYAPLKQRDLRIGNYLYLQLAGPVTNNQMVEVKNPSKKLWPATTRFNAKADFLRYSPAIHVNQVGYLANSS